MQRQEHKWDHTQCSYCGNQNTQFICWRCHEIDIEELRKRLEMLEFKFNELIDILYATNVVDNAVLFSKVKEAQ